MSNDEWIAAYETKLTALRASTSPRTVEGKEPLWMLEEAFRSADTTMKARKLLNELRQRGEI